MRKHHTTAITVLIGLAGYNLALAALAATEKPAITYKNLPIPIQQTSYKAGEIVRTNLEYCVTRSTKYTISQKLVELKTNKEYFLPAAIIDVRWGELAPHESPLGDDDEDCRSAEGIPKQLPKNIPKGTYKFLWTGFSDGRYANTVEYRYESQTFTIR